MYAKYTYVAGSTLANILSDVGALLTGQTDKNLLSANCDKTNTEILTTYSVAGWTMHDAAASASSIYLKAPAYDSPSLFNYVGIDGSAANTLEVRCAESWNAVTHVGTNVCNQGASSVCSRISLAAGGVLYISASSNRVVMLSIVSGSFGSSTGNSWQGALCRTRGDTPGDTIAAAYPNIGLFTPLGGLSGSSDWGKTPRVKDMATGNDATQATCWLTTFNKGSGAAFGHNKKLLINGTLTTVIFPLSFNAFGYNSHFGGNVSTVADVWLLQANVGSNLDEITYNGKSYVIFLNASANTSGSLLVPKG